MKISNVLVILFTLIIFFTNSYIIYLFSLHSRSNQNFAISPISFNKKVLGSTQKNVWLPNIDQIFDIRLQKPELTAISALSYDLTSNKLLFSKNIKQRLPIASITKIMTAIITLENDDLNKVIAVSKKAASTEESFMGISEGEKIAIRDLLYGAMLPSGNDATEAIAEGSILGRNGFINKMNQKAKELGLKDTRFTNPSGLEDIGVRYSTAYDLLVISRYAIEKPEFLKIVSTYEYHIPASFQHKDFLLYNGTSLLTTYPGVKGIKVGNTDEAGYCIVTYLEHEGSKIIAVLLNSQNRREEMKQLLDYSLKTLGYTPPPHP